MHISVWEKESFYAHKDVIIAGGGFTGLWSAYHLKKKHPKLSVTIIDRGIIPTGASTRNAGFACFGSVTELMDDVKHYGEDSMLELVEMRFKGLQYIRKVFSKKTIDFEKCGGYELFTDSSAVDINILDEQIKWLNHKLHHIVQEKKTFRRADKKIKPFGFNGITHLLENKPEGYLHSGKLCQALLQLVQSMGVSVLTGIEISGFEYTGQTITLHNKQQLPLSADQLLICTNAFAQQLLPELDVQPARGQVLVTSPIPNLAFKGTFHYDEGFYYFRNLGNRVLLGGARNKAFAEEATSNMDISNTIQQELEHFLSSYLLPGIEYSITDRWSGIMGMGSGSGKMPLIQEVRPRVFCAVRMSGMGVALAPLAGEKAASLLLK
ncbi:MAG: FAD-dependent oxidoreductase [Chitinophagaceae bacterium]